MFRNSRYFNDSKMSLHKVAKIPTSCLNLQNYQQFYLLGILGKLNEKSLLEARFFNLNEFFYSNFMTETFSKYQNSRFYPSNEHHS